VQGIPEAEMKQLLMFALLALGIADAWACRCGLSDDKDPATVENAFAASTFVAEIEVVSAETVSETVSVAGSRLQDLDGKEHADHELATLQMLVAQVQILKLWKGDATVTGIETGYVGNTCGNFMFHAGEKVLVYGSMTERTGRASAHACGRRVPLAEAAADIAILEKIRRQPHHEATPAKLVGKVCSRSRSARWRRATA
jgi:hypothetical protein